MAFTLIQSQVANSGTSGGVSSQAVTTTATGSGHLLVAGVTCQNGTGPATIGAPASWVQIGSTVTISNTTIAFFYLPNSSSGVTSFTFTASVSSRMAVVFEEWSGVATASPLDQTTSNSSGSTTTTATTGTTAALAGAGELGIWFLGSNVATAETYSSVLSSYVEDQATNSTNTSGNKAQGAFFYNTSVGAAATSSGATLGTASAYGAIIAAFKAATITPVLATSPTTLSFNATVGGASPATQNDTLSETAGAGTAWTSSISYGSGSGWLGISPSSGTLSASGTQTVVYTCTTGALAVGTYTATVTYTATTGGSTATVGVTFVVNATPPALSTSPTTLLFSATVGGSNPATQNDTLTNTGGTSSAWTSSISYGSGSGWLGIAASSGTLAGGANATIVFTCTTGALAVGTYTATVTFTATTGGATATVAVTFVINSAVITYSNYKLTIEPQLVAALNAKNLLNYVQLIGPDTTMVNDSWLTSASTDLSSTLAGYVRHAFPTGASDISNDSREVAVKSLISGIYANDPTTKPVIQGEMGFAAQGPGQSVTLFQYGVEMADYAVQLARAGMAALIAYILDDDMHGVQWGMWQISDSSSTPRPWAWIWAVLSNTLVAGSQLYASAQPTSNDFRFLAAQTPQGAWTFVLVNRKALAQNIQIIVPFAPVASTSMQSYVYSNATPLLLDGNGFALSSGAVTGVLSRGFTVPIAANSVLVLSQATAPQNTIYDVKRPPLQRRR